MTASDVSKLVCGGRGIHNALQLVCNQPHEEINGECTPKCTPTDTSIDAEPVALIWLGCCLVDSLIRHP